MKIVIDDHSIEDDIEIMIWPIGYSTHHIREKAKNLESALDIVKKIIKEEENV